MGRVLAANVWVLYPLYMVGAVEGDGVPPEVAALIGDHCWEPSPDVPQAVDEVSPPSPEEPEEKDTEGSDTPGPVEPPRAGRGSSRDAWADHAATLEVTVTDDMTRDDIIAAVDAAQAE